jgi:glutamate carboxypeptidase
MTTDALRDRLIRWCNQNSGSENFTGLEAMRGLLATAFAALPGATVEHVPLAGTPAQALRIRVRPEAPHQLLLSGHYDTVYEAKSPFQSCTLLDADTLRGPGVADMKGGLVVMLAALHGFRTIPQAKARLTRSSSVPTRRSARRAPSPCSSRRPNATASPWSSSRPAATAIS